MATDKAALASDVLGCDAAAPALNVATRDTPFRTVSPYAVRPSPKWLFDPRKSRVVRTGPTHTRATKDKDRIAGDRV